MRRLVGGEFRQGHRLSTCGVDAHQRAAPRVRTQSCRHRARVHRGPWTPRRRRRGCRQPRPHVSVGHQQRTPRSGCSPTRTDNSRLRFPEARWPPRLRAAAARAVQSPPASGTAANTSCRPSGDTAGTLTKRMPVGGDSCRRTSCARVFAAGQEDVGAQRQRRDAEQHRPSEDAAIRQRHSGGAPRRGLRVNLLRRATPVRASSISSRASPMS